MRRGDRLQAERLESAVARHKLAVARADTALVAELGAAGFPQVKTTVDAYRRLEAQRKLPGLTQNEIDIVLNYEAIKKAQKAS